MTPQPPKKTIAFIAAEPQDADGSARHEARAAVQVPVLLRDESGEPVPGIGIDLSASGLRILLDARFAPAHGLLPGCHLACELYLGEVEVRRVELVVRRVDDVGHHQLELGCAFVELAPGARVGLRREIARRLAAARSSGGLRPGR